MRCALRELLKLQLSHFAILRTARSFTASRKAAHNLERSGVGQRLHKLDFGEKKGSETLFIMGSGASVNQYSKAQWTHIQHHDSLGLNWWPIHAHVPTYHLFELTASEHVNIELVALLQNRIDEYQDTIHILKDLTKAQKALQSVALPLELLDRLYLPYEVQTFGVAERRALRLLRSLGVFSSRERFSLLYKRRASLASAIALGLRVGYKKVVLCGVDLSSTRYFWEENPEDYQQRGIPLPRSTRQAGPVHKTIDPKYGNLTVDKVVLLLRDEVLTPRSVELFVAHPSSALYPKVPLYPPFSMANANGNPQLEEQQ